MKSSGILKKEVLGKKDSSEETLAADKKVFAMKVIRKSRMLIAQK
jgi:hypothetical protein